MIEEKEEMQLESQKQSQSQISTIEKWDDFELRDDLLRGIYSYGFEAPSEIQKKAIIPLISGKDLIAQAQSGSGKTGTFTIGILQNIDITSNTTQAMILAPTHELAKQITSVIQSLGAFIVGLRVKTLIGGTSVHDDAFELRKSPPHIVVGCTGRIFDMIRRGNLNTKFIRTVCLDEADELLMGFKQSVYDIFQKLNDNVQIALFSATMPEEVVKLSQTFMQTPNQIMMKAEELNLECIHQTYLALMDDREKYDTLKNLFSTLVISQCIIYANSVGRVMDLYHSMTDDGFSVGCIHSNMSKLERDNTFQEFRTGNCRVLISSNITARGIDVQQVSTVVNFDLPNCVHTYLHRIGRSGRWGRKGLAINLITRRDIPMIKTIEKHYQSNIVEFSVPPK
jgi:superfamily II DNA/RNA helicase